MLLSLFAFILLRLFFWVQTFPNPDEAYYWLWGQHLDWSYYDHPPLQAWIQGTMTALLGRSPLTLRLPNLFSNALLFYTYYRICHYLYREKAGLTFGYVVLLILASPLYFLFLALAWNDHALVTGGLISSYCFITFADGYIETGRGQTWRLYAAAIALGLAWLCKYNAIFIGLGFVATLIVDSRLHRLWRDRRLYTAIAITGLLLLPIVFWNVSNQFQSFHYYLSRSVTPASFGIKISPGLNFILFSILMVSPVNAYGFMRCFQDYFRRDFRQDFRRRFSSHMENPVHPVETREGKTQSAKTSVYATVAIWTCLISSLCLTIVAFLSAGLYYWNITAYLLLFPLIPSLFFQPASSQAASSQAIFSQTLSSQAGSSRPVPFSSVTPTLLFRVGQGYGLLFAGLLVIHYSVFPLSALVSTDADPDSRMLWGWDQVAAAVRLQAQELGDRPRIVTTDYRSASALAYQLYQTPLAGTVSVISDRVDQFDVWAKQQTTEQPGQLTLLLADDWHPFDAKFLSQFHQVSAVTALPIRRWGHWIKNYYLAIGESP